MYTWSHKHYNNLRLSWYEPQHDKTNKVIVRPAKTQISLGIRPVGLYVHFAFWALSSLHVALCWIPEQIWAASWQNQQNEHAPSEDSDQPGHPPSLIRVFAVRMKKPWVLSYLLSAQRRLWSDWADAQAGLSLHWAHAHFVGFCHEAAHICSGIQHNATCKAESAQNVKCTYSPRYCICSNFNLTNHLLNVSIKRQTANIFIIMPSMTTEEREQELLVRYSNMLVYGR